jgi:hypothetical protein
VFPISESQLESITVSLCFLSNCNYLRNFTCKAYASCASFYLLQHSTSTIILPLKSRIPSLKLCRSYALVIRSENPQNADFPRYYSRKEKKPFPVPVLELRRAARERFKKSKGQPKKPVPPPKNGLIVKSLVPLAYDVFNARIKLINNLKKLLKVVRVHACR